MRIKLNKAANKATVMSFPGAKKTRKSVRGVSHKTGLPTAKRCTQAERAKKGLGPSCSRGHNWRGNYAYHTS